MLPLEKLGDGGVSGVADEKNDLVVRIGRLGVRRAGIVFQIIVMREEDSWHGPVEGMHIVILQQTIGGQVIAQLIIARQQHAQPGAAAFPIGDNNDVGFPQYPIVFPAAQIAFHPETPFPGQYGARQG